jgi:hypothetical protein
VLVGDEDLQLTHSFRRSGSPVWTAPTQTDQDTCLAFLSPQLSPSRSARSRLASASDRTSLCTWAPAR